MMKMHQAFEFRHIVIKNLISCMHLQSLYRVQYAIFHICMQQSVRDRDRIYLIFLQNYMPMH